MEKIISILSRVRPEFDFTQADQFITQGYFDSFDMISLVTELDSTFGISIDGTDIVPQHFESVASIAALLRKKGVDI